MEELCTMRKIDKLSRFTLPKEYTKILGIKENDYLDIILSEDKIILKKHNLSVDYEGLLRLFLTLKQGESYENYFISKENIEEFEKLVMEFTEKIVRKEDVVWKMK